MKKYVLKATALAIGALVGGAAVASVDFSASPFVATTDAFATELNYSDAGTAISGAKTITTKLGFGVSNNQTRFIRVNLTGAKFAAAADGTDVTNTTTAFNNSIVAQGGGVGATFVIYQVTGDVAGHTADDIVTIVLPNLHVTNGQTSPVSVSYALYADAVAAANQTAGTSLSTQSGDLFGFKAAVSFKVTNKTATATVADQYKKFNGAVGPVEVGQVALSASGAFAANGAAATLANLLAAGTKMTVTGDFGFTKADATATNLRLGDVTTCANGVAFTSIAANLLSASYTLGDTATTKAVCVSADAAAAIAIPVQNLFVDFDPVGETGVTVANPGAALLGDIARDGTTLQAPFVTIHPDYLSRVVLSSTYSQDVPVTFSILTEGGATCTTTPVTKTLAKNSQLLVQVKDICPSLSDAGTRFSVIANVAAPRSAIQGVYNVMNYDATTGKTNSLISHIMVAPGTN